MMAKQATPIDDGLAPLAVRHSRAKQILAVGDSTYREAIRDGKIKTVGSGRGGGADYQSILDYHRARLAEPGLELAVNKARRERGLQAAQAARRANRELAAE
jgi:hypothetical protein